MINGRTMLPLRFVAETFEVNVIWHGENRMVELLDKNKIAVE